MAEIFRFQKWHIPERMMPGIRRYVDEGIKPGDFLTAFIEANLIQIMKRADGENLGNLPAYFAYFYNECPAACWGSKEKREAWMKKKRGE